MTTSLAQQAIENGDYRKLDTKHFVTPEIAALQIEADVYGYMQIATPEQLQKDEAKLNDYNQQIQSRQFTDQYLSERAEPFANIEDMIRFELEMATNAVKPQALGISEHLHNLSITKFEDGSNILWQKKTPFSPSNHIILAENELPELNAASLLMFAQKIANTTFQATPEPLNNSLANQALNTNQVQSNLKNATPLLTPEVKSQLVDIELNYIDNKIKNDPTEKQKAEELLVEINNDLGGLKKENPELFEGIDSFKSITEFTQKMYDNDPEKTQFYDLLKDCSTSHFDDGSSILFYNDEKQKNVQSMVFQTKDLTELNAEKVTNLIQALANGTVKNHSYEALELEQSQNKQMENVNNNEPTQKMENKNPMRLRMS